MQSKLNTTWHQQQGHQQQGHQTSYSRIFPFSAAEWLTNHVILHKISFIQHRSVRMKDQAMPKAIVQLGLEIGIVRKLVMWWLQWLFPSLCLLQRLHEHKMYPDSKVHGANMGPTWVLLAPNEPHVGPINLAIRVVISNVDRLPAEDVFF